MASLADIAAQIGGHVVGDASLEIRRVAPIDEAREGDLTFISNPKYVAKLETTQASAVIAAPGVQTERLSLVVCGNPYLAFARAVEFLHVSRSAPLGVMDGAHVHPEATLGDGVTIHPGCVVSAGARVGDGTVLHPGVILYSDAEVGNNCLLHANVIVREGCRLGDRVIVQPGAVIGSDGFGYASDGDRYVKIPQVGIVEIGDDVEIGAASCVDRAALGVTRIGRGTKIDNLVQIGHNVVIGEDTILVSQVGIAGSTTIGNHCTFGGQGAAAGHLRIGNNVTIAARGAAAGDIPDGQIMSGAPAMPHKDWLKASMVFPRIPDMRRELQQLRKKVAQLEKQLEENQSP